MGKLFENFKKHWDSLTSEDKKVELDEIHAVTQDEDTQEEENNSVFITEDELYSFKQEYKYFIAACYNVAKHLIQLNVSYKYIDNWELRDDTVFGNGYQQYCGSGGDFHYVDFDSKLLTYTDSELEAYVQEELEKRKKLEDEEQREREKRRNEHDRQEYERLKKIFG